MKRAIFIIAINLVSALVLLLVIEGIVRVMYPELGPIGTDDALLESTVYGQTRGLKRGATGVSNGVTIRVDEKGFISYEKPYSENKPSILFVGDSITMGLGVDPDSTFAGLLSASLDTVNVLNPSVIGYSSTDYKRVVRYTIMSPSLLDLDALDIQRVIVFWCLNDIYADIPIATIPGGTVRRIGGSLLTFLRRHARLYQVLKDAFFDRSRSYYEHDELYYTPKGLYFQRAVEDLKNIQENCKKKGIPLSVILFPYEYQVRHKEGSLMNHPQETLMTALADSNLDITDLGEFLRSRPESSTELYLFGDGIHFSKKGHKVIAEYLLEHLASSESPASEGVGIF